MKESQISDALRESMNAVRLSPALRAAPRYTLHQPEHTPRTLFDDDASINQQIGAEILLALGAEADTADNGLQALRLIRTRHLQRRPFFVKIT